MHNSLGHGELLMRFGTQGGSGDAALRGSPDGRGIRALAHQPRSRLRRRIHDRHRGIICKG